MSEQPPEQFFELFEKSLEDTRIGYQALDEFMKIEDKQPYLEPTLKFLKTEDRDGVRSWGTNLLGMIGGKKAFTVLVGLLNETDSPEVKKEYVYTRFYALNNLSLLAQSPAEFARVDKLCLRIWQDKQEDDLVQSEAAALLAEKGDREALNWLSEMLGEYKAYWPVLRALYALREVPLPELADDVLKVLNNSQYTDHRYQAIRTLEGYKGNVKVVRALGDIVLTDRTSYLRMQSVISLGQLADPGAQTEIFHALTDDDAEIRYQAAIALCKILPPEQAVSAIVQAALNPNFEPQARTYLVEALRQIDPTRAMPTQILSRELTAEDRQRAEVAEKLLIDLGGWAAVQRLSQRSQTLNRLDSLLSDSEAVVRSTFESTIRQARRNFYFAMGVNIIIVITGIILVGLAISQLIQNPENLTSWVLPGAAGFFGVLFNLVFNNPRRNARDDLAALINVTVIFLGFLRQLNEIDATFKHAYLEDPNFNAESMRATVTQIETTVGQALRNATEYLRTGSKEPEAPAQSSAP